MARIALIIPCYNDGATLGETVNSARHYPEPLEILVIDDGSTDRATLRLMDELSTDGVRVIHQENQGLSRARMAGVAATTAPYIFPLDSDDRLDPGPGLSLLADALDRQPELQLVWGDYMVFGAVDERRHESGRDLDPWLASYINDTPVSSLIRRDALLQAGGWTLHPYCEDWDLWMACAERGFRGARVPAVVYHYRHHAGLRMRDEGKARQDERYEVLRERHSRLFGRHRRELWLHSSAPLALRVALPLIELLPINRWNKSLLGALLNYHLRIGLVRAIREKLARAKARRPQLSGMTG